MRKLFIHQPIFRIFSPVFSGVVVYLLILLLNNNVEQLQEQFLGEELYVCIGLSYLIQELSRGLLLIFKRIYIGKSSFLNLLLQLTISLVLCILIVSVSMTLYYKYVIGYSASTEDIIMFDVIFSAITLIYILLFISHQYLYKINSDRLQHEELIKQNIEDDFRQFKRGINPHLLFESFDALLILMHEDPDKADEFIDHLSTTYRYILTHKDRQLVELQEELKNLLELESLFNKLPYRNICIKNILTSNFLVVPGSLLFLIELILRNTITSSNIDLEIKITEDKELMQLSYKTFDKVNSNFITKEFEEIRRVYSIYSDEKITIQEEDQIRTIKIPKLTIKS